MPDREPVDVEVTVMDESDRAYAIQSPDEDAPHRNWIWLPKSQVTLEDPYRVPPHDTVATIPEWLAMEKGLI